MSREREVLAELVRLSEMRNTPYTLDSWADKWKAAWQAARDLLTQPEQDVRNALEEAAKVCDEMDKKMISYNGLPPIHPLPSTCAAAIRALKEPGNG